MSDNLVPVESVVGDVTNHKAKIAFYISLVGGILTFLVAYFPDNEDVQTWGGLILGLLTVAGTTYGVYQQSNYTSAVGPVVPARNDLGVITTRTIAICALVAVVVVILLIWVVDVNKDNDKNDNGNAPIGVRV